METESGIATKIIEDKIPILEAKAAFIHMACIAMSIVDENSFDCFSSQKAWEGLAYFTSDIERELREMAASV